MERYDYEPTLETGGLPPFSDTLKGPRYDGSEWHPNAAKVVERIDETTVALNDLASMASEYNNFLKKKKMSFLMRRHLVTAFQNSTLLSALVEVKTAKN